MYFRSSLFFRHTWLFDDVVNGPILYNEQIEEDTYEEVWEAENKHWDVYCALDLDSSLVIETAEEFEYRYEDAQWVMEYELEEKFGFGGIIAT